MDFKTFVSDKWNSMKEGATKTSGKLKEYGTVIDDKWTNQAQPWIQNTLGEEGTDMLAGVGGQLAGAVGGEAAGALTSMIPVVGSFIAPFVKMAATAWLGTKTADKISPGLGGRVSGEKISGLGVGKPPRGQGGGGSGSVYVDKNLQTYSKKSLYTRATRGKSGKMKLSQTYVPSGLGGAINVANNWHRGNRFGNPSVYGGNGG